MFSFYKLIEDLNFPNFEKTGDNSSKSKMGKLYWMSLAKLSTTDQYQNNTPEELHDKIVDTAKKVYKDEERKKEEYGNKSKMR